MAATTEKSRVNAGHEFFAGWDNATQAWRDVFGFQFRTAKTVFDQSMGFTRKATEHFSNQLEESFKFQQDAFKYGFNLVEDWKKTAFDSAEKAFRPEGH